MSINNFLHLYLEESPSENELKVILSFLGFELEKVEERTSLEDPVGFHWRWKNEPLSEDGFKLVFYFDLFADDSHYGKYHSYAIIAGTNNSSDIDLSMIDITSLLLLRRYGGIIHNPERKNTMSYLCGQDFEQIT